MLTWIATAFWLLVFLYTSFKFVQCIRLVPTQSAYIVERLGKYQKTLGPGFHLLVPFFDRVAFIQDLKEESIEVPPQECFTNDNVKVEVDGILYISVMKPEAASYGITDYRFAAIQLAQTTIRSVVGTLELDRTFEEREALNSRVLGALAEVESAWGMKVHRYEVKNIVTPDTVRDAMERQMGAERDRRALLAKAEGQMRSLINESEGKKTEMVNRSEGETQRRINEAQGRAAEILAIARATADSIETVGAAISQPGGIEATNLTLSRAYLEKIGRLAHSRNTVLLPADLTHVDSVLDAIALPNPRGMEIKAPPPPQSPARRPAPTATPPRVAPSQPARRDDTILEADELGDSISRPR